MSTTVIRVLLLDTAEEPVPNARASAKLLAGPTGGHYSGGEIVSPSTLATDEDGIADFALKPNIEIEPPGSVYRVSTRDNEWTIEVPQALPGSDPIAVGEGLIQKRPPRIPGWLPYAVKGDKGDKGDQGTAGEVTRVDHTVTATDNSLITHNKGRDPASAFFTENSGREYTVAYSVVVSGTSCRVETYRPMTGKITLLF